MADEKRARLILELEDSDARQKLRRLQQDFSKGFGAKFDFSDLDKAAKQSSELAQNLKNAAQSSKDIKAGGGSGASGSGGSGGRGSNSPGRGGGGQSDSGGGGIAGLLGKFNPAIAGATVAVGYMAKTLMDAANRATEFSKSLSDGGGKLDQTRKARSETDKFKDAVALSDTGTGLANAKANFEKMLAQEEFKALVKDPEKLQKQLNSLQLRGGDKIELDRMKRGRGELESDLAREQTALERQLFEQRRDLAIEGAKIEEDFYRKRRDFAKEQSAAALDFSRKEEDSALKKGRLEEDNAVKLKKFYEDFAGQQAATKYQEERRQKARDFAVKSSDKTQDFTTKQSDRSADFARDRARSKEDFQLGLTEMALNGADAKSYLLASLRFQKDERRANEDFSTQSGRDTRDFATEMGRDQRDAAFEAEDAARARSAELLAHEYERRQELLQTTLEYTRALQDLATETKRRQEDRAIQLKDFADKGRDLETDYSMARQEYGNKLQDANFSQQKAREDFAISSFRQRRGSDESFADFAGGLKDKYGELATGYLINNSGLGGYAQMYEKQAGFAPGELTNMYSAQGLKNDVDLKDAADRMNLISNVQSGWQTGGIFGAFTGLGKGIGNKLFGNSDSQQFINQYGTPEQQAMYNQQRLYNPANPIPNLSFGATNAAQLPAQLPAPVGNFSAPQVNAPLTVNAGLPNGFEQQLQAMQARYAQEAAALVASAQGQTMRNVMGLLQSTGDARIR